MQMNKIKIKNFKSIENMEIDLKNGINLIIGNNGVGKTTILDAISVALGGYISGIDGIYGKNILKQDIRISSEVFGTASYNILYHVPVEINCEVTLNSNNYQWTRKKNKLASSRTTLEPAEIKYIARDMLLDKNSTLPVISYQGASRMWVKKRLTKSSKSKKDDLSRRNGYLHSLTQESNNRVLLNWCKKMERISWEEKTEIKEYESVKNAVSTFMSIINDSEKPQISYETKSEEFVYRVKDEVVPISYLSAGYQSLIWMVFSIAYRMAVLNPNKLENVITDTPGIVLIDEIEVHLHPQWQWKVLEALEKTFPLVQFVITTHSPLVLSSARGSNIINVNSNDTVEYKTSSFAVPIDLILSEYQEGSDLPKSIKKQFKEFDKKIDQNNLDAAEKILSALKQTMSENNPRIVNADLELQFERFQEL